MKLGLLFAASVLACSCNKLCKGDPLTLLKVAYNGGQIRTDGYYFGNATSDDLVDIYFLYENGVFFNSGADSLAEAQSATISIDSTNEFSKRVKGAWGVFQVNGTTVEIERWQSSINGCETTVFERGDVLTDSAFIITYREYRSNGQVGLEETPNSLFQFRAIPIKPDSTNPFI